MRDLVEKDGSGGGEAQLEAGHERGSDSQAVKQIVSAGTICVETTSWVFYTHQLAKRLRYPTTFLFEASLNSGFVSGLLSSRIFSKTRNDKIPQSVAVPIRVCPPSSSLFII